MLLKMTANDLDLLKHFADNNSQDAFTALVHRHLGLVYSAALRQVRSPQLAEEISQSVFADLARNAGKLKSDTILTAWLYQVTRRTAIDVIRKESRRQLREQIAVEMNTMNATSADWTQIEPLLDDAMAALDETDRSTILLRYFENKNLREVGEVFGTSEDAAQKRVSRAIERLREFFSKRNVTMGTSGLAVLISANAVQAAPVGLVATISAAAALAGTAVSASTVIAATKTIAMTTLQKTIIGLTLTAAVGTGIYEAHQASQLLDQVQTLQQQQAPLAEQIRRLRQECDDATNQLAAFLAQNAQLKSNSNEDELLKLRAEVTRLQSDSRELAQLKSKGNSIEFVAKSWLARAELLKQRLEQTPNARIPEFQFLTDGDWLRATEENPLLTDEDYRKAFSQLRGYGERLFLMEAQGALQKYLEVSKGQFPGSISDLQPYFKSPVGESILEHYEILPAGDNLHPGADWSDAIITVKSATDEDLDVRWSISQRGMGTSSFKNSAYLDALVPAINAFIAANNGKLPNNPNQIASYATTPEQQAALQTAIENFDEAKNSSNVNSK